MRADAGYPGKGQSGSVGGIETAGRVEAVTHWKLLGSSVRPLSTMPRHIRAHAEVRSTQTRAPISLVSLDLQTGSKHQLRIHLSKVLNGEETPSFPPLRQSYMWMFNATYYDSTRSWRSVIFRQPQFPLSARCRNSTRSIPTRIPRLLLRKLVVSSQIHIFTPITSKPSFPYPHSSDFHHPRPHQPSRRHRSSCSYAHYTFILQSYRQLGSHKRFRIGVTAPLPPYFVQACKKLKIPLADELIEGGVCINDVRQDVSHLREGEGTENGMRWLV